MYCTCIRASNAYCVVFIPPCAFFFLVVDEQNTHTDETELPSPLEFRKDSEEENRDSEKDEDTKELEALPCKCTTASAAASALFQISDLSGLVPFQVCDLIANLLLAWP